MSANDSTLAIVTGRQLDLIPAPQWPPVSDAVADALAEVYRSRRWSFNSPAEQAFSNEFAAFTGAKHAIFMANGTTTLECALLALGIGRGDEVIVPAMTWPATAMAVHFVGAIPVFVDVEPDSICMDPKRVEEAITPRTAAIMPVHVYGGTADLEKLLAIANKHSLSLIEDCAHMHGGRWAGRSVGTWGKIGSFSFQQSKTMASGEGGICITNDDALADRLYRAKHIGYSNQALQGAAQNGPPEDLPCHNYRATAFQAVILSDQLRGLADRIALYNRNRDIIQSYAKDIPGIRFQARGRLADPQGYYSLGIIYDEGPLAEVPIDLIRQAHHAEGLMNNPTYGPVYKHVLYTLPKDTYRVPAGGCPVAETAGYSRMMALPHQWLGDDDKVIHEIGRIIAKVARGHEQLVAYARQKKASA